MTPLSSKKIKKIQIRVEMAVLILHLRAVKVAISCTALA
jgi:hypothetical protein